MVDSTGIEELVSNIILAMIYVLIAFIIGRVGSKKLYELIKKLLKFRIIKERVGEESYVLKIIEIITLILRYVVYLIGVLLAVRQLKIELADYLTLLFVAFVPNLIAALFFLIIGIMLANLVKRTIKISIENTGLDELFYDFQPKLIPSNIAGIAGQYFIIMISIAVALTQLGLKTELISWLALVITTVFVIFTFLFFYSATKPYLPDIVAGLVLRNKRYLRIGENVSIDGVMYRVIRIGVAFTKVEKEGKEVILRNSKLLEKLEISRGE